MIELTIQSEHIRVLSLFTSKRSLHRCLNGINLEIFQADGTREGRLAATNGHLFGVFRLKIEENLESANVTIPNNLIAGIRQSIETAVISIGGEIPAKVGQILRTPARSITIKQGAYAVTGQSIPAGFPDWRRVAGKIKKTSGKSVQFDPNHIAAIVKAAKLLGTGEPIIYCNGNEPALIDLGRENFFGMIMPLHGICKGIGTPTWALSNWND